MSLHAIKLPYNVELRNHQRDVWNAIFLDQIKQLMLLWHRRAGKDDLCVNATTAYVMEQPMYALYLLPEQRQARKVIWDGVTKDGKKFIERIPKKLIKRKSSVEMLVEMVNGSIIQLAGSDNYNSLVGTNPKLIVHSEFALSNPFARQYLRPILVENGGVEIIISTPRGMNHMYTGYNAALGSKEWYVSKLTVEDTYDFEGKPLVAPWQIDKERANGTREEVIQSEYYCSFEAAILGAYYATQLRSAYTQNRIKDLEIDPDAKTITMWDLGFSDQTAIWIAQVKNGHLYFIKYYANYGQNFEHYAKFIHDFAKEHKISWHAHIAPHDINVTELFGTKKTRLEKALDMGIRFETVPRTRDVTEEIGEVRDWFPYMYFDRAGCAEGLACLSQYHSEFKIDDSVFKTKPKHDWASHGADALRTGIVWYGHHKMKPAAEPQMGSRIKLFNPLA